MSKFERIMGVTSSGPAEDAAPEWPRVHGNNRFPAWNVDQLMRQLPGATRWFSLANRTWYTAAGNFDEAVRYIPTGIGELILNGHGMVGIYMRPNTGALTSLSVKQIRKFLNSQNPRKWVVGVVSNTEIKPIIGARIITGDTRTLMGESNVILQLGPQL